MSKIEVDEQVSVYERQPVQARDDQTIAYMCQPYLRQYRGQWHKVTGM